MIISFKVNRSHTLYVQAEEIIAVAPDDCRTTECTEIHLKGGGALYVDEKISDVLNKLGYEWKS